MPPSDEQNSKPASAQGNPEADAVRSSGGNSDSPAHSETGSHETPDSEGASGSPRGDGDRATSEEMGSVSPHRTVDSANDGGAPNPGQAPGGVLEKAPSHVAPDFFNEHEETLNGLIDGTASEPGSAKPPKEVDEPPKEVDRVPHEKQLADDGHLASGQESSQKVEPAGDAKMPPEDSDAPTRLASIVPDQGYATQNSPAPTRADQGAATVPPSDAVPLDDFLLGLPGEIANHPRYRPLELLGQGGMGSVYKAKHRVMERVVALKVIRPELTRDDLVERFRREIRAAAKLSHPNIVIAHDAEQAGDVHFLVVEFVEGQSLDRVVAHEGALKVDHACELIRQAADGLQHASECGMVHRDIKPQNLMCTSQGQVKILDFGLALVYSDASATSALTHGGGVMGTPDYIAPEQADDAHAADIRSDVYSLGCTLYFLLRGKPPFAEGSIVQKLMSHVEKEPPSLRDFREDVPVELCQVIAKAMAKKPDARYQTPESFSRALKPFAEGTVLPTLVADSVPPAKSEIPPQSKSGTDPSDSHPANSHRGGQDRVTRDKNGLVRLDGRDINDGSHAPGAQSPSAATSFTAQSFTAQSSAANSPAADPSDSGMSSQTSNQAGSSSGSSSSVTSDSSGIEFEGELVEAELIPFDEPHAFDSSLDSQASDSYVRPSSVNRSDQASKLALCIGLITLPLAWIPCLGVLLLPFSLMGLALASFSIYLSSGIPEHRSRYPWIAAIVCSISIALSALSGMMLRQL